MITILTCLLLVALVALVVRWLAAVPLARTLSIVIDSWADGVHGSESDPLR